MTSVSFEVKPGSLIHRFQTKITELSAADLARRQPLIDQEAELYHRRDAITARMTTCRWPADVAEYALLAPELELLDREIARVRAAVPGQDVGLQRLIAAGNVAIDKGNAAWQRLQILQDALHPDTRAMTLDQHEKELSQVRAVVHELLDPDGIPASHYGAARAADGTDIYI